MDFFKYEYGELYLRDGILFFTYYPVPSFDLRVAQKIVADRMHLQREESFPILCDIRQVTMPNLEARNYLALEGSLLTKAVAYLVGPHLSEHLIRFFIYVSQPPVPAAVFTSREEAIAFLEAYKS